METVAEIFSQLGLNQTVWYQLVCFIVSWFFLSNFLFKPYLRNLDYRRKNSTGSASETATILEHTATLTEEYHVKLRKQNEELLSVYDEIKSKGKSQYDEAVASARQEAQRISSTTKAALAKEIASAKAALSAEVPTISKLVASRVLGREVK